MRADWRKSASSHVSVRVAVFFLNHAFPCILHPPRQTGKPNNLTIIALAYFPLYRDAETVPIEDETWKQQSIVVGWVEFRETVGHVDESRGVSLWGDARLLKGEFKVSTDSALQIRKLIQYTNIQYWCSPGWSERNTYMMTFRLLYHLGLQRAAAAAALALRYILWLSFFSQFIIEKNSHIRGVLKNVSGLDTFVQK